MKVHLVELRPFTTNKTVAKNREILILKPFYVYDINSGLDHILLRLQ